MFLAIFHGQGAAIQRGTLPMLGVNKQKLPTVLITVLLVPCSGVLEAETGGSVRHAFFFAFSIILRILSTPLVLSAELFYTGPLLY